MFSKSTITIFAIILFIGAFVAIKGVNGYKQSQNNQQDTEYTIGIIQSIEHSALDMARDGTIDMINNLGQGKVKVMQESAHGDASLAKQIVQKFIQQKVNAIITIGTTVTQVAMQQTKNIPIVFASVTDPIASGIVKNVSQPEANITGISDFTPNITSIQLQFFKKLMPQLKTIGIIYNPGETNSVRLLDDVREKAIGFNIDIKAVPAQDTNEAVIVTKTILNKVDAIFINNDNTALGALKGIVDTAMKYKVPVLCSDTDTIPLGVFAAVGPNQFKLGQDVGKMAIDIILNKKQIKDIPVKYTEDDEFMISATSAALLKIQIPEGDNIKVVQ